MAADSLLTWDDRPSFGPKIFRLQDGSLLGCAGNDFQIPAAVKAAESFVSGCAYETDFVNPENYPAGFLLLANDGIFEMETGYRRWIKHSGLVAAIGSGSRYALGAYGAGASLEKAVQIAIDNNVYCGGEVVYVALDPAAELEAARKYMTTHCKAEALAMVRRKG